MSVVSPVKRKPLVISLLNDLDARAAAWVIINASPGIYRFREFGSATSWNSVTEQNGDFLKAIRDSDELIVIGSVFPDVVQLALSLKNMRFTSFDWFDAKKNQTRVVWTSGFENLHTLTYREKVSLSHLLWIREHGDAPLPKSLQIIEDHVFNTHNFKERLEIITAMHANGYMSDKLSNFFEQMDALNGVKTGELCFNQLKQDGAAIMRYKTNILIGDDGPQAIRNAMLSSPLSENKKLMQNFFDGFCAKCGGRIIKGSPKPCYC